MAIKGELLRHDPIRILLDAGADARRLAEVRSMLLSRGCTEEQAGVWLMRTEYPDGGKKGAGLLSYREIATLVGSNQMAVYRMLQRVQRTLNRWRQDGSRISREQMGHYIRQDREEVDGDTGEHLSWVPVTRADQVQRVSHAIDGSRDRVPGTKPSAKDALMGSITP